MNLRPDGLGAALSIVVAAVVIAGLVVGAELVTWIMMATFFAILVRPLYTWLLRHRVSVALSLLVVALLLAYNAYKWWARRRFFAMLRGARIHVDDLYRLIAAGEDVVIVDVRSPTARSLEPRRIPGAVYVPLQAVDQHARELPRDREIILYCTCPNEVSAAEAAKLLMNSGFTRVRPLHGGLEAWIAAGHTVESI